jgi:hypothetical protein
LDFVSRLEVSLRIEVFAFQSPVVFNKLQTPSHCRRDADAMHNAYAACNVKKHIDNTL